jgi:probable H4MPT-linked C1 transfer pathway protein
LEGQAGLLVDIGSTTSDIIPLLSGRPNSVGVDDTGRLLSGELLYMGVKRTPVCAIMDRLPWRGERCPIARELFATTADAYIVLGRLEEQADDADTADGRPATREFARERLARLICADATKFTMADAATAAAAIHDSQIALLMAAAERVAGRMDVEPKRVILSGIGEFLADQAARGVLPKARHIFLSEQLGRGVSESAAAHALAILAAEGVLSKQNDSEMIDRPPGCRRIGSD